MQQSVLSEAGMLPELLIRFIDDSGKPVLTQRFRKDIPDYDIDFDIAGLKPGAYAVEASLIGQGKGPMAVVRECYTRYAAPPPWHGDKTGITDRVPAPWEPLRITGTTLACWGRTYAFNGTWLPSGIASAGQDLLSAPVKLDLVCGGNLLRPKRTRARWVERGARKARFQTRADAGALELSADFVFEFDGFVWVTLTLNPRAPVTVDKMTLEIPFRREYATLVNGAGSYLQGTGAIPESGWRKNLKTKQPIFWVGNEAAGIQWFAENLQGWFQDDPDRGVEIRPREQGVSVRINITDRPFVLKEKKVIAFGLMATPVKPKPSDWRTWRVSGTGLPRNICFMVGSATYLITPLFNYPDPREGAKKVLDKYKQEKTTGCIYLSTAVSTPFSPEFRYQGELWRRLPGPRVAQWDDKKTEVKDLLVNICPNSPDYRDFYLWKLDRAVRELDADGLYFDYGWATTCSNALHGCGWNDWLGKENPTFNILGTRELAKRVYVMMKSYKPHSIIAYHMSDVVQMPVHSFADIMVDGETLARPVGADSSYYRALPLDTFRAECMPHQWGSLVLLLSEFTRGAELFNKPMLPFLLSEQAAKPMNHFIGLILVHDSKCWNTDVHKYLAPVRAAEDTFGWDEKTDFLPYWNNAAYVRIETPVSRDVVVSAFRRPGKVMLVPFNNTDDGISVRLNVDFERLGLKQTPAFLSDALSRERFPIAGETISVPLSARSFRMLVN